MIHKCIHTCRKGSKFNVDVALKCELGRVSNQNAKRH